VALFEAGLPPRSPSRSWSCTNRSAGPSLIAPLEAWALAARARRTFEDYGDEVNSSAAPTIRSRSPFPFAGREVKPSALLRAARDRFLACGLYGAYVSALNSIGLCLLELGDVSGAKHEYALALRTTQRLGQTSYRPYLRMNLSRTFFAHGAGRWPPAASRRPRFRCGCGRG
jgi:hypothetical protein